MRRSQADHPLIYGGGQGQGSENDSERSSRLQAEVQRQLDEYKAKQQLEVDRLQNEIRMLRAERDAERRGLELQGEGQGRGLQSSGVPEGNQGQQPPPSIAASRVLPEGLNVQHQAPNVPGANQGVQHQLPNVPGANPGVQHQTPNVPRANQGVQHQLPNVPGANPGVQHQAPNVPGANQGVQHQLPNVPGANPGVQHQAPNVPGENQGVQHQLPNVPGANPGAQPQLPNVPGANPGVKHHPSNVPGAGLGVQYPPQDLHGLPGQQDAGRQSSSVPGGNQGTQPPGPYVSSQATSTAPQVSTAQQWLGQTSQSGTIAMLADGMAQLQAAMIKQYDKASSGDQSPEAVKPGTSALPPLKEVNGETACVDIMDWLELIDGPMSDLSDSSAGWWRRVTQEAHRAYGEWSQASPMDRLSVSPEVKDLEDGKYSRVNSRAAAMVVTSLHETVRQEVVARRLAGTTVGLIFRLLTLYQPGGEDEKFKILQNLQAPAAETEAGKAVSSLRAWSRWLRRCRELNVQAPDPSLLARGLSTMVRSVLEKSPDASFRTSLVKSTLQIDTTPSYDKVDSYYKHLMAECEALSVSAKATPSTTMVSVQPAPKPDPKLRPMKPEPKATPATPPTRTSGSATTTTPANAEAEKHDKPKSEVQCRFFGRTAKGCTRAAKCPFKHSWEGLEKKDRCLVCGGKGHAAKECPTKKAQTPPSGGTPKAANERQGAISSSSSTTTARTVRVDDNPEVVNVPAASSSEASANSDLKEVLADVGRVLKAMTATTMKKFSAKKMDTMEPLNLPPPPLQLQGPDGLLDSGASHAMRPATSTEYESGCPVKVTLAGEDVRVLKQNPQGTILVREQGEPVQPIVPLGALIENLGYTLQWGPKHLKLTHPEKGPIKVKVKNHCPEVAASDALDMIRELELAQVKELTSHVDSLKARLEVLKKEEQREWPELLADYMSTGRRSHLLKAVMKCPVTKCLPGDVQTMLLEDFDHHSGEKYLKALPLTRRKRKALLNSNRWVVSLYLGEADNNDPFKLIPSAGKVLFEVDIKSSRLWDMHLSGGVYQVLLWAAAKGKICDIVSSLPDRTWPTSHSPRKGNEAIPLRTKSEPFGRNELPPFQQQQVHRETACAAKQLVVWMVAMMANKGTVGFLMELPGDPEWFGQGESPFATMWNCEMWKSFKSISGVSTASFDMGAYGHRATRPTTLGTNYQSIGRMNGDYNSEAGCLPASLLTKRVYRQWSHPFKRQVALAIADADEGFHVDEQQLRELDAKLSKLTKEQREAWRRHLENDHQPYRADCSICINAQATGYKHKRVKSPHLFTVAMDLAGPFVIRGRDLDHNDYKYLLVASYRCPKEYLSQMAIPEVDRELYVPDEEELPEDDPLELEPGEGDGDEAEPKDSGKPTESEIDELEQEVEKLTQPVEDKTIYLTRPLRSRTTSSVLTASKEIVLQLRQNGLHINSVHSDRAREFGSKAYKSWLSDSGIGHTRTAGGDPTGNSTAELGVKWAKARIRALLKSGGAEAKDWPMAAHHASSSLWSKAFPSCPTSFPPAATFGCEVWFRAKAYKGTKEKKQEATGTRWKKGWYRGPSLDVSKGHLILREDGGLTIAKSVKFNVVEPDRDLRDLLPYATAEDVPKAAHDDNPPSKNELSEEIEFVSKELLREEKFTADDLLYLFYKLEELGDVDMRVGKKKAVTSWYTGSYVHGGRAGPRRNVLSYPNTSRYLVEYAKRNFKNFAFAAVGIARNAELGMHRDSHNSRSSMNAVLPLTSFEGGALWTQDEKVPDEFNVSKELPNGQTVRGRLHEMKQGEPVMFNPTVWHEVQPWSGERIVLLAFTPRGTKLTQESISELEKVGFEIDMEALGLGADLPELEHPPKVKMMRVGEDETNAFIEMTDGDLFPGGAPEAPFPVQPPRDEQPPHIRRLLRKAEVQYTSNIEAILSEHLRDQRPLEVTHTVSLQDVKRNLDGWKDSAWAEFVNLKEKKQALSVRKRAELPPGCRIVPCKGVYTVKPDKKNFYRRKTRFVACGNHVLPGQEDIDLYAAGIDATSLRTMLSYTIRKPWRYGTTDIRQAFVLAPWLGSPVALQPPAIAYELGLAEPGEYWYVDKAIYGLRESPALWSRFRNEQLALARWYAEIDGVYEELRLDQMITDDQIWRIVRVNGDQEPLGYVMVYIDDLLINALPSAMDSFFNWVAAKWECDDLDVLQEGHPIRFLGMELHMKDNGLELAQEGFVRELLRSHGHDGSRSRTQGPKETLVLSAEEEEAIINAQPADMTDREMEVREAQRRVGECLWLAGRTRPDIQYITALLSSRTTRCPDIVNRVGERLLSYLNETLHYRLRFSACEPEENLLKVFTDSSFAPSSGRSHGASCVFLGNNPLTWRSSRQQLVTLSTAETELLEGVEGTTLGVATRALLEELENRPIPLQLHIDNQAALLLLQGSTGSWRTRHLRLRANYIREKTVSGDLKVVFEPGATQRADLGTKPFTRERLKQLLDLWNMVDRREVETASMRTAQVQGSWLKKLVMFCQVCSTIAQKEQIKAEVPWDLYIAILVLAVIVIVLWETVKGCWKGKDVRLRALRARAGYGKITRAELKELQRLLALEPADLTDDQARRMLYLRDLFQETMPPGTSPIPTISSGAASSSTLTHGLPERDPQASSSTTSQRVRTRDQGVQKDYEPAFQRVVPQPLPEMRIETFAGPYHHVPGSDTLHIHGNCWGLRNTGRAQLLRLCRCCVENGGRSLYNR